MGGPDDILREQTEEADYAARATGEIGGVIGGVDESSSSSSHSGVTGDTMGRDEMRFSSSRSDAEARAESESESELGHGTNTKFVANILGGLGLTPMPHQCRKGAKICRQRYRGESDFAALRRMRRIRAQSDVDSAMASIRMAVGHMCSGYTTEGSPLPPLPTGRRQRVRALLQAGAGAGAGAWVGLGTSSDAGGSHA